MVFGSLFFFFIFFYMKNQSEQTLRLSENRRHHVQRWSSFFCNINAHFIWRFDWNRGFGWFISFFCDQFTLHHRDIFILQDRNNMPGLFIFSWFWVRWEIETLHHQQFLTFIASGLLCTGPPRSSKNATLVGCYMLAIWILTQLSFCSGYWAWTLRSFFKSSNFQMATIS